MTHPASDVSSSPMPRSSQGLGTSLGELRTTRNYTLPQGSRRSMLRTGDVPSGFDSLLQRSQPSTWQKFWNSPRHFSALYFYQHGQDVIPKPPSQPPITVVCMSDTHNDQPDLPPGDILIHAGDLTQSGTFSEIQQALDWLRSQPHPHKIVVAGNHDVLLDPKKDKPPVHDQDGTVTSREEGQRAQLEWGDIIYLNHEASALKCGNGRTLHVFGSPFTPKQGNWAFQYPRSWKDNPWNRAVPDNTDILITHDPPHAHLDLAPILGCQHLLREVWRARPALHVFGHIHGGYGVEWAAFTRLQDAYESAVDGDGGVLLLLALVWEAVLAVLVYHSRRVVGSTVFVNAAIVGGPRDEKRRKPIVVII